MTRITESITASELEAVLRELDARITIAGKGGLWTCVAWLDHGKRTVRGDGATWWEAVGKALQ